MELTVTTCNVPQEAATVLVEAALGSHVVDAAIDNAPGGKDRRTSRSRVHFPQLL
jgi:hypothetical protein